MGMKGDATFLRTNTGMTEMLVRKRIRLSVSQQYVQAGLRKLVIRLLTQWMSDDAHNSSKIQYSVASFRY